MCVCRHKDDKSVNRITPLERNIAAMKSTWGTIKAKKESREIRYVMTARASVWEASVLSFGVSQETHIIQAVY